MNRVDVSVDAAAVEHARRARAAIRGIAQMLVADLESRGAGALAHPRQRGTMLRDELGRRFAHVGPIG